MLDDIRGHGYDVRESRDQEMSFGWQRGTEQRSDRFAHLHSVEVAGSAVVGHCDYFLEPSAGPRAPGFTSKSSGIIQVRPPINRAPGMRRARHSCCIRSWDTPCLAAASADVISLPTNI